MDQIPFLTLEALTQLTGLVLIEFGASWCSHCQAAQPTISAALLQYPQVKHIKEEDGKGKRLGRQFSVKLWPTLVLLNNGVVVGHLVRPENIQQILDLLTTA